jgi:hypothetical protein
MCQPGGSVSPGFSSGSGRARVNRSRLAGAAVTTSVVTCLRPMYVFSSSIFTTPRIRLSLLTLGSGLSKPDPRQDVAVEDDVAGDYCEEGSHVLDA